MMPDPTMLTTKEKKVLQLMRKGKSMNDAVQESYNTTRKSARTMSSRLRKRKRFLKYLDAQGLTSDLLVQTIVEGLKSNKVIVDKLGNEHFSPHVMARLAAAKEGIKLRGLTLEEEEKDHEQTPLIVKSVKFELHNHKVTFSGENAGNSDINEGEIVENEENTHG